MPTSGIAADQEIFDLVDACRGVVMADVVERGPEAFGYETALSTAPR